MSNKETEIPSAAHFLNNHLGFIDSFFTVQQRMAIESFMIEFADLHREQALKTASEKALIQGKHPDGDLILKKIHTREGRMYTVNADSILSAYPKEKIR